MEGKLPLKAWRKMVSVEFSADGVVSAVPIFLFGITMMPTAAGAADIYLYHGTSPGSRYFRYYYTVLGDPLSCWYNPPLYCPTGLYVDVDTNIKMVHFDYLIDEGLESLDL